MSLKQTAANINAQKGHRPIKVSASHGVLMPRLVNFKPLNGSVAVEKYREVAFSSVAWPHKPAVWPSCHNA